MGNGIINRNHSPEVSRSLLAFFIVSTTQSGQLAADVFAAIKKQISMNLPNLHIIGLLAKPAPH